MEEMMFVTSLPAKHVYNLRHPHQSCQGEN
jgi:hypothetical protein